MGRKVVHGKQVSELWNEEVIAGETNVSQEATEENGKYV